MNHQNGQKWIVGAMTGAALVMSSFATMTAWAGACVVTFEDGMQSCYQILYQNQDTCEVKLVGKTFTPPGKVVSSGAWNPNNTCKELGVKLLATDVELAATKNATGGVDLELITTAEQDTAELLILRGEKRGKDALEVTVVCVFPSGGSPYTCTDNAVGDLYQVAEIEYDGSLLIQNKGVKPKK